jgi:hypothetical protein
LAEHANQSLLAGSCIRERFPGNRAEAERFVKLAIGEKASIGSHDQSAKMEHKPAVEIEPENPVVRFARWVRHHMCLDVSSQAVLLKA